MDLIDRQTLMKEFSDFVRESNNSDFAQTPTWNDAVSLVGSMPSEQPKRKNGEWVKNEHESAKHVEAIYFCSSCHNFEAWGETERYNFCPNCGADMRGEE